MRRFFSILLICLGTVHAARAQDPIPRMQQFIQSYVTNKTFMGTVLVSKDGKLLINEGYGFAQVEWNTPNIPEGKFRLGSLTKQFTAAGILLLEEQGKLKVEDPVSKYVSDAPPAWEKITIFDLLTHTSGIPNFTNFPDYGPTESKDTTPQELVARFRDKPLEFPPATKFSYSNSGYILLGYILEKVSGQTYADFLQKNIFTPLGMYDTGVDSNTAILPKRVQGYVPSANGMQHAGYVSMTVPFSAGALYSTTGDLLKWEQGLFRGKVINPASLAKMTTPFKEGYGFGLFIHDENGHKRIDHGGGIEGFNTSLAYYPDDKLVVVVLANLNGNAADALGASLGKLALGEQVLLPFERKEVQVPEEILQDYVGAYQLAPNFILTMTLENGQLMTQATGQPKFPLFAESDTKFFLKVVDAEVEFIRDPTTHSVTKLVLYQNGTHEAAKQ